MITVTDHQLLLLHHMLGVTPKLRAPFRNHYVASSGHREISELDHLESIGLVERATTPGFLDPSDIVFRATEAGQRLALARLELPPKRSKYEEFLDADYGHSFSDWLGIETPTVEYDSNGNCRYSRMKYGENMRIQGEWKLTKKDAKASYKTALKRHHDQIRQWMKPSGLTINQEMSA